MQIANFAKLAQELVEAAAATLMRMRTVNIMDSEGVIIASTESDRIGTLHTGAREVAQTGKELLITTEMLSEYPGAREGYNMPLVCCGEVIGVIGLYGKRSDVTDLAHLLRVYAEKYFELEAVMNRELADTERKGEVFRLLSDKTMPGSEKLEQAVGGLGIHFFYPLLCIRIVLSEEQETELIHERLGALSEKLIKCGIADTQTDLLGVENGALNLIHSLGGEAAEQWTERLFQCLKQTVISHHLFVSREAVSHTALWECYQQVHWMGERMNCSTNLLTAEGYVQYLLYRNLSESTQFLDIYEERLRQVIRAEELDVYLQCMDVYLSEEKRVGRAAEKLFIHKNTVQYRVNKLYETLGLSGRESFVREYIMRLLIKYIQLHCKEE